MTPDEQAFMRAFEDCTLPIERFHHRDHLHMAWLYLQAYPFGEALDRFVGALRAYAASLGKAGLYHATITYAYLLLLQERIERSGRDDAWEMFAAGNADLFEWKPSILQRYYSEERLKSDLARQVFLFPDRVPEPGA
ncbi:MAG: hypothetical protein KGN76_16795 [Acidobacteriota bacterium]|nr:hypothetical protein [Acidobacteriota bacterium]